MNDEPLEFTGVVLIIYYDSNLIDIDGDIIWIPNSLCDYFSEPVKGHEIDFEIPKWFAEQKGLI